MNSDPNVERSQDLGADPGSDDKTVPDLDPSKTTVVDARGLRCPLPVIHLARLIRDDPEVTRVTVLATDPAAAHDIPAWCRMRGHEFAGERRESGHAAYDVVVVRASGRAAAPSGPRRATPGSGPG